MNSFYFFFTGILYPNFNTSFHRTVSTEQSGNSDVGVELQAKILGRAVENLKNELILPGLYVSYL